MIKELRAEYPVHVLYRVLGVSSSGFHAWLRRKPSARARLRELLKVTTLAAHQRTRQTYGAQRLQKELAADGFVVSLGTVKRVRRETGPALRATEEALPGTATDSSHQLPVAANLLGQDFQVGRPDEVWTADITYVATDEGWLYVAAIKDLFAGEVVARGFGARMTAGLAVRALERAWRRGARPPGLSTTWRAARSPRACSGTSGAGTYRRRCAARHRT